MIFTPTSKYLNLICSFQPKKPSLSSASAKPHAIPARDRVIDFGKYKGKMLGALPSNYLKWISKNLRAGDSEHWAKLADQVLQDSVYQDRVEWEFADRLLNGNNAGSLLRNNVGAVSQLLEMSERFGWDNEDKAGWSKVKFDLLGTSRGGRIPRKVSSCSSGSEKQVKDVKSEKSEDERVLSQSEMRRKERRERGKLKKEQQATEMEKQTIMTKRKDKIVTGIMDNGFSQKDHAAAAGIYNPFHGREALFKKMFNANERFL